MVVVSWISKEQGWPLDVFLPKKLLVLLLLLLFEKEEEEEVVVRELQDVEVELEVQVEEVEVVDDMEEDDRVRILIFLCILELVEVVSETGEEGGE